MRINFAFKILTKYLIFAVVLPLLVLISTASTAESAVFGTTYEGPMYVYGGGNNNGQSKCATDEVVVGIAFHWNPMSNGYLCRPLNASYGIDPLPSNWRTTYTNYVFCPDGKAAAGYKFMKPSDIYAGLICKSPPGMNDTEVLTDFISGSSKVSSTAYSISFTSGCNSGDFQIGQHTWSNLWFDQLAAVCAPFAPLVVTYNANSGTGTAPASQSGTVINPGITISNSYTGTRVNYVYAGWNTLAAGTGVDYTPGASINLTSSMTLYAKWNPKVTFDANGATSGVIPDFQTPSSPGGNVTLSSNTGNLAKSSVAFTGWNTNAAGTGTHYAQGAVLAVTTPLTLYAEWTSICTPTSSYSGGNKILSFSSTSNCAYQIPSGVTTIDLLVVGGGGGGGGNVGSGGGGGGVNIQKNLTVTPGEWIINKVGAGGTGAISGTSGTAGAATTAIYGTSTFTGSGGSGGVQYGGVSRVTAANCATTTYFTSGGTGGGTGGAGGKGGGGSYDINNNACAGLTGVASDVSGTSLKYGGGGGGGAYDSGTWILPGAAGDDSAGAGGRCYQAGFSGAAGRGGGGGGGGCGNSNGGGGGAGVILISFNSVATVTFDLNGGSGTLSSTSATQSTRTTPIKTSTITTPSKSGFSFAGWNTKADGTGTNYAENVDYLPGSTTLYAQWNYTITYNGNTNTSGTAPSTETKTASALAQLSSNSGTLLKTNYYFAGWNSAANGTGTLYQGPNSQISLPLPYAQYDASSWSGTSLVDLTGNGRTAITLKGSPTTATITNSSGTNKTISVLSGGVNDGFYLPNIKLTNYTLCYVGRYSSTANKFRLIQAKAENWLSGFWSGQAGVFYHGAWVSSSAGLTGETSFHVICDAANTVRSDSVSKWTANSSITYLPANIGINTSSSGEASDWQIADLVIYDSVLSTDQISIIEAFYKAKYGLTATTIPDYKSSASSFNNTYDPIPGNLTVYAQWNSIIKYDGNGNTSGTVPNWTTAVAALNTTLATNSGTLAKTGNTLVAWNTQADGLGSIYALGKTDYVSSGNVTLYAQWLTTPTLAPDLDTASDNGTSSTDNKTNDNTPTITAFNLNPGATVTITATSGTNTYTCTFVASATTDSCTFTSLPDGTYSFTYKQSLAGTSTTASPALTSVVIDTVPPTVVITNNTYVSGSKSNTVTNSQFAMTFSEAIDFAGFLENELSKSGSNWYFNNFKYTGSTTSVIYYYACPSTTAGSNSCSGTGTSGAGGALSLQVPANVTTDIAGNGNSASNIYVISWVATVTYNANGGSGSVASVQQDSSTASINLSDGTGLTRTGYSVTGWSTTTTGSAVANPYSPTLNTTLYAIWTAGTYTVTFNSNGATGSPTKNSDTWTYAASGGTGVNISTAATSGTMVKTGYSFIGWNTTANATTALTSPYPASNSANITLYAVWTANTYAVSFDANGGSGSISNMSIVAGTAKALTSNTTITRSGYTFAGWNTAADGSGTSYANGASVTVYGNLTVYAKWTPIASAIPTAISATAGNTTLTVSATAGSTSTTAGPTTSMTITAYIGASAAGTCTYSAPATSCIITGLTNGTAYTLKAVASNSTGSSTTYTSGSTSTPAGYLVTYDPKSGSVTPTSATYNSGTPLVLPLPTRTGYNFGGWYSDSAATTNFIGGDGSSYSPEAAITLYAKWTGIIYTITYNGNNSNSGTVPSNGSYQTGAASPYPVADNTGALAKTGYTFGGWNTRPDGNGTPYAVSATYSTSANLTLYAKWTANTYTITYNGNGGGTPTKTTDSFTYGGTAVTLPGVQNLAKSGYTFMGWLASQSDTSTVISPYSPTGSITLYAYWVGNTYSINYDESGATGTVADTSFIVGSAGITLPSGSSLTKVGYSFGGWAVNGSPISNGYVPSGDVTISAIWTPVSYSITYDKNLASNDVNSPPATTGNYGSLATISNVDSTTVTIGGDTFVFAGWNISYDGSGVSYAAGTSYRFGTSNVTLFGQWVKVYEVKYILNGGTLVAGEFTYDEECGTTHQCTNGQTITLNSAPSRAGYIFQHWSVTNGGSAVSNPSSHAVTDGNYILYAVWSAITYTVNFDKGPSGATGTSSSITGGYGALGTLAQSNGFSYSGYKFTGWQISGQSTNYSAGASYVFGTDSATVTMVAQWANNNFTIYFDANGGTATGATSVSGNASSTVNLPSVPTKTGYEFAGWNTGSSVLATNSATTTMGSSNATYIATWTLAAPSIPSITATPNDGGATISVTPGVGGGSASNYTITANTGASCSVVAPATSCTIAPLTNGTTYTFTATATNATGTSSASGSATAIPAGLPSAPTSLSAVRGNGQATVTFSPPTDTGGSAITNYTMTATPVGGGSSVSVTCSSTPCVVTGLTNGTAYTFAAVTNNAVGASTTSTSSSSVTPAAAPAAPAAVTVSSNTSGTASVAITAGATNGSAITSYTVTATPASGSAITVTCTSSPCAVTGLTDGTAYTYSVTETNAVGTSTATSASGSLTTQAPASAPTNVQATAGNTNASVTFTAAASNGSTINSYTVTAYDQSGNATSDTCTVTVLTSPLGCTVSGLTNGAIYTFKVTTNSTSNGGSPSNSSPSDPSPQRTPAAPPSAPTINAPVAGSNKVTLTWSPGATNGAVVTGYTVTAYLSDGTATSFKCIVTDPTVHTCDVTGLAVGVDYKFAVVANSVAPSDSAASNFSSLGRMNSAPSQPDAPVVTPGNGSASVAMNVPVVNGASVTSYTVTATPTGSGSAVTVMCSSSPCNVTGLTNGTSYAFTYTATNSLGTSIASPATSATPYTVPGTPTSVHAGANDGGATITYTAPAANGSSITGYVITATPVGGGIAIVTNDSDSPSLITGLTNGVQYSITVAAINAAGTGTASTPVLVTPATNVAPSLVSDAAPSGNLISGSTLIAQAAYSGAPTPTVTYKWQSCENGTCQDISGATANTYTLTSAEVGKTVRVETIATNVQGSANHISPETLAIVTPITFTSPSSGLTGTVGTAYSLTNTASGGASPITYSVSSGSLPAGITLETSTGLISGTPTTAGTTTATITATDSRSTTATNSISITISATPSSGGGGSGGGSAPAPAAPVTTTAPTCDSTCQSAKDAIAAQQTAAKAAADAAAATAKATADAAALAAAKQTITTQQALATQAAQAATNALAAQQVAAAQAAAAVAAAQVAAQKAAQIAAAAKTTPIVNSVAAKAAVAAAQSQATALAQQAAIAVKSASTAAATAVSAVAAANTAQSQLAIQITNIKVNTSIANNSATAAKEAVAIATTQQAAAKAAQANAVQVAAAAKVAADKAAADAAAAAAAKAAAEKVAADAAAAAIAQQKIAEKAAVEKATADKAAADAATKLSEAAQNAVNAAEQLTKATTAEERAAAQSVLDAATVQVTKAQSVVEVATKAAETKAEVLAVATSSAEKAQVHASDKSDQAVKAAEVVAVKQATVDAAKQVVESVTQQLAVAKAAVATATANVAAAAAVAAKVSSSGKNTSSTKIASTAKVSINNLKPGQRIVVTVNKK